MTGWETPPSAPLLIEPTMGDYPDIQCPKMDEWQKGEKIGSGGFGSVYKCLNRKGEFFAVKQVPRNPSDSGLRAVQSLEQLKQEVMMLSRLHHPNIVQYIGSDMDDENLYIFLEFLECGSIQKVMQKFPDFSEDLIRSYTRQILLGLDYLHENGTVHRDIKGSNILVSTQGRVKLADFGVARHIGEGTDMTSCKGTVWWMAPEAITGDGYGWQVDIWSLGCTVIEMVTRVAPWLDPETLLPPWGNADQIPAIWSIGRTRHPPPIPKQISPVMHDFISQCLQIDPSLRPPAKQLLLHPFVSPNGLLPQSRSGSARGGGAVSKGPPAPALSTSPVSVLRGLGEVRSTVNQAISSMAMGAATSPASPRPPGLPLGSSASGCRSGSGRDAATAAAPPAFDGATSLGSNAEDTSAPPSPKFWRRPKDTDGRSSSGRSEKDRFSPESNRGPHVYPVAWGPSAGGALPEGGYLAAQSPGGEGAVGSYHGNFSYESPGRRATLANQMERHSGFPPAYSYGGDGVAGVYGPPYDASGDGHPSHFMPRQGYYHPRDDPEGGSYPPVSVRLHHSRAGTPGTPPSPPRYPRDPPPEAYPSYVYRCEGPYPCGLPDKDNGGGYQDLDESERRWVPSSSMYDPAAYLSKNRSPFDGTAAAAAPPSSVRSSRGTPSHSPRRSPVHTSQEAWAHRVSPAGAAALGGGGSLQAPGDPRRTRSHIPPEVAFSSVDDLYGGGAHGAGYPPPGTCSPGGGYLGGPVRSASVGLSGSLLPPGGGGGRYDQPVVVVPPRQMMRFSPSPRSNSPQLSPDGPLADFPAEVGKSEWELFKERQRAQASEVVAGVGTGGGGSRTPGGGGSRTPGGGGRVHVRSPLTSPRKEEWGVGALPFGVDLQSAATNAAAAAADLGGGGGSPYRAPAYGPSSAAYGVALDGTRSPGRGVYAARAQERVGALASQATLQQPGAAVRGEELIEQLKKLQLAQRPGSLER